MTGAGAAILINHGQDWTAPAIRSHLKIFGGAP
jgi:hypothetical protein